MKISKISFKNMSKFFRENKKILLKLLLAFIGSIILSVILEVFVFSKLYKNMATDRIFIMSCAILFVLLHFIIPLKKMYNFIYEKRYIIAIISLIILVLLGYSGSSINMYNQYVPSTVSENTVILGKSRGIRSDEWAVNTPLSLSQNMDKDGNKLPYFSEIVRGTKTDMYTIIHAPILDILTITKPFTFGYLFGNKIGLSFWWYGRLIALMLISFEFCMLLTKKNKLVSLCGMLMITFAPAVQWWYSNFLPDLLIWGQLALLMINEFLECNNLKTKIISAIGFVISGCAYIFTFYPSWEVPLGYVFLAIFIWIVIKNRKIYKFNKVDILIGFIVILCMGLLGIRYYSLSSETLKAVLNTSYPGKRFELGGNGIVNIFGYVYNIFTPYKEALNPSEMSSMISFYPIPIIVSLIYMFRNKKGKSFIIPLMILTILFSIWTFIETNETFAKFTLLYLVKGKRITIPLGLIQSYLIIYLLGNIQKDDKILKENIAKIISVIATICILYLAIKQAPAGYMGPMIGFLAGLMILVGFYLLFSCNANNIKKTVIFLSAVAIIGGITVNPIIRGNNIIYETQVAKKVQEVINKSQNSIWITESYGFPIANYLVANGAATMNCTNYYPNEKSLYKIFGEKIYKDEIKEIYNRYAHISINLIREDSSIELIGADHYRINLNYKKLKDLNVDYILSSRDLSNYSDESIKFNKVYYENGMYIYNVIYDNSL